MRDLVSADVYPIKPAGSTDIPKVIIQYWNDPDSIPEDVQACIDSWHQLSPLGFSHRLFGDSTARAFIATNFEPRHVHAFDRCNHPAMRADFFRLCFILTSGGFYVDADDVYHGRGVQALFNDGQLKLQPLCYEISTDSMVDPFEAAKEQNSDNYIFYVNNNPLLAPAGHPLVEHALERATTSLLGAAENDRDIQSLTGPGNLTTCLVEYVIETERAGGTPTLRLVYDWDRIATSKWPLSYRSDLRNWRQWVQAPTPQTQDSDKASR
jgi:mannosyltransferase OCH1-like enzyme